jgi:DNA-dependent protein kinase catalytic subunit
MGRGPESYLAIRSQFARTLAATSMCSYVLGIGDRHLENFLVDQTTGAVIPIDFGMAFGQGASLPVPELIPFRLTPQVRVCTNI